MLRSALCTAAATLALGLAACTPQEAAAPKPAPAPVAAPAPGAPVAAKINAPAGEYKLDPTHASLFWQVRHLGLSDYTARLTKFDATVQLNPDDPTKSSVEATIDPSSVQTDYPGKVDFDKEIRGEKFLNVAKFPTIGFKSTSIETTGANTAKITGDLTFFGITKPVVLDATLIGANNPDPVRKAAVIGLSATATFKRSAFGFNTYQGPVGDDVTILINAEFIGPPAPAETPASPPPG